jgi:hypothetical protein
MKSIINFGWLGDVGPYQYYVDWLSWRPFLFFFGIFPLIASLVFLTKKFIEKRENLCLLVWYILGFGFQLWLLKLVEYSLEAVVISPGANSYYGPTLIYEPIYFLKHFLELAPRLPLHATANMPGKILFYYFLELFTTSPFVLGLLIIAVSNLGAYLTYAISKRLFKSKVVALYSFILYLFMPSKLAFFPILNTVSPLFILAAFLCFLIFLESREWPYLIAVGTAVYLQFLFEPIPLVLGFLFVWFLVKAWLEKRVSARAVTAIVGVTAGTFFCIHLMMLATLNFDIFEIFFYCARINSDYYATHKFPQHWFLENLHVFFQNVGFVQSLLAITFTIIVINKALKLGGVFILKPASSLTLGFMANLLVLNALGTSRAEVIRLWIFMGGYIQVIASYLIDQWWPKAGIYFVLAATLLQASLTLYSVLLLQP